mgnify:CR=1 FL=1
MNSSPVVYVAACVLKNFDEDVLLVQRPSGKSMEGLWEFPGGKIEKNESPEQALVRELKEELGISVKSDNLVPLHFVSYRYSDFQLVMLVYGCCIWEGSIKLCENQQAFNWVSIENLKDYKMPPADLPILEVLCS